MLKIKNIEVFGLERACAAAGNPMSIGDISTRRPLEKKDIDRFNNLGCAVPGSGHDNFLSGILVTFDIKYPQYWSLEFQRYHFIQIISSQSKMHRIAIMGKDENFSKMFNEYVEPDIINRIKTIVNMYNDTDEVAFPKLKYELFMRIMSNLPMGFEMWMTVTTNYLQLKTIYNQRKNHKLKEDWNEFCTFIESLPRFTEIIKR